MTAAAYSPALRVAHTSNQSVTRAMVENVICMFISMLIMSNSFWLGGGKGEGERAEEGKGKRKRGQLVGVTGFWLEGEGAERERISGVWSMHQLGDL